MATGQPAILVVRLKNGSQEPEAVVLATMITLQALFQKNPVLAYELNERCKNPSHEMWANSADDLRALSLLQHDNSVHASIRNIVLSAIEGEGLGMTLASPIRTVIG